MATITRGEGKGSISIDLNALGVPEKKRRTAMRQVARKAHLKNVHLDSEGWLHATYRDVGDFTSRDEEQLKQKMQKLESWMVRTAQNLLNKQEQAAQAEKKRTLATAASSG